MTKAELEYERAYKARQRTERIYEAACQRVNRAMDALIAQHAKERKTECITSQP